MLGSSHAPDPRSPTWALHHGDFDLVSKIVPTDAQRFENLVAAHLLKWVHFQQDTQGRDVDLRYFRDTDGREVDFVIMEGKQVLRAIEAKWSATSLDPNLRYLKAKYPTAEAWQIHATGDKDFTTPEGIRVAPALELLRMLV